MTVCRCFRLFGLLMLYCGYHRQTFNPLSHVQDATQMSTTKNTTSLDGMSTTSDSVVKQRRNNNKKYEVNISTERNTSTHAAHAYNDSRGSLQEYKLYIAPITQT